EECAKVIAQVECAKNVLLQQRTEPQGLVKISCPLLMMRFQIRELINHFLKAYPKVEIELELTSRRVDVLYDDIDIAIRTNFEMTEDSSLIVRDVIKTTHCLVAAPEVLQGQHIESHQQLTDFPCIGLGNQKQDYGWILRNYENNQKVNINFNPRMRCNDLAGVYYAACDGLGIADLPYLTVEEDIKQGKLIHILPEWESNEGMVQLVYASRKGQRLVVEKLIETLVGGMRSLGNMKKGYRLI
ncbi:LysR substrate-binding domain-containing protein, partial [Acinetobacter ursingii]